jgi:hypothetical protein
MHDTRAQWTFQEQRPTRRTWTGTVDLSLTHDVLLTRALGQTLASAVIVLRGVRVDPAPVRRRGFLDLVLFVAASPQHGAFHVPSRCVEFLPDGSLDADPLLDDRTFFDDWLRVARQVERCVQEHIEHEIRMQALATFAAPVGPWWPPPPTEDLPMPEQFRTQPPHPLSRPSLPIRSV